ncbi:MAG: hypothetical protein HZB15_10800 [Actinobacteria bacterium]|nr:hypothetical protein [Actinomycetota bacterium]
MIHSVPTAPRSSSGATRRWSRRWTRWLVAALSVVGPVAACTSDPADDAVTVDGTDARDPAVVAASNLPDPAQNASNGQPVEEEPAFVQVNANTATTAELVGAFDANGIDDGATWAALVIDHRPYGPAQPSGSEFDELRDALAAAGLDELDSEAIVASLTVQG